MSVSQVGDYSARIALHLRIRTKPGQGEPLLAFLRDAASYYEQPGGIKIRLLRDLHDEDSFVEVIEYDSRDAYEQDQLRVERDPVMKGYLDKWRSLLQTAPILEAYVELTPRIQRT